MKILQTMLASLTLAGLLISNAVARDSFNIGINVGGFGYAPPVVTHYPNTIYYSNTPTVIYYSAPPVVRYVPNINYQHYHGNDHFRGNQRDYYGDWNNRWRDSGGSNRRGGGYGRGDGGHREGRH